MLVTRSRGRRRTLLVVGGAGRLGRRLARFFARRGFAVFAADPAGAPPRVGEAPVAFAREADVVVVSASLPRMPDALSEVLDAGPRGLVFDIASVKAPLLPLFGRAL